MRRVAITGSGRGLGRAMVEGFTRLGWQVASCSRSTGVDVSRWTQVEAWAQEVISAGVPDLVLNNAALINRSAPLWEIDPNAQEWAVRAVPFLAGLGAQHNGRSLSL